MEALSYKYFVVVTYEKPQKHRVIVTALVDMALGFRLHWVAFQSKLAYSVGM